MVAEINKVCSAFAQLMAVRYQPHARPNHGLLTAYLIDIVVEKLIVSQNLIVIIDIET